MPRHDVQVQCSVPGGFAVDAVRGMFDIEPAKVASESFSVEIPADDELIDGEPWRIGVIVGPSGSGKTTVARHAYGKQFVDGGFRWEREKAVVDHFGKLSMKVVTQTLTSVGFSSPPAWLKPHHVLSGGERFRCDLARALLRPGELVAFDEFTSVVDRNVAKIGSAAVAKSIRKGRIGKKFVAVTCHYDVLDWLEPDWVLDMSSQQLARGRLHRRPPINIRVTRIHPSAWRLFRRHHYLDTELSGVARCFAAFWGSEPVAFSAWMHAMTRGRREHDMREHRTVVLPDFQGVGIGNRVSELCASIWTGLGGRSFSTTSQPGMIHYRDASPHWRTRRFGMVAPTGATGMLRSATKNPEGMAAMRLKRALSGKRTSESTGRVTGGFQYVGPAMDATLAAAILADAPRVFGDEQTAAILQALADAPGALGVKALSHRAGVPQRETETVVRRLVATGEVHRVSFSRRVAYSLAPA